MEVYDITRKEQRVLDNKIGDGLEQITYEFLTGGKEKYIIVF